MRNLGKSLLLALFVTSTLTFSAVADAAKEGRNTEKGGEVSQAQLDRAERLQLAASLAKYGMKARSADALILSAQLYGAAGSAELDATKSMEGSDRKGEAKDGPAPSSDPEKLLDMASKYSSASQDKRIEEVRAGLGAAKGPPGGTKSGWHRVDAYTTDVFQVVLQGGEPWAVTVNGDGDTDLDLYVYDENGSLIESDTDGMDYCVCSGRARWTGPFTIRVKNLGSVYNDYFITVE